MRYRPEQVVALLDSERAGETEGGFPIVGSVDEALALEPTTALVGVATAGGRFPPAWRELLKRCIAAGLDVENGLHEFISDDPELSALAARHGVELRDLRKPPAGLNVPTGENLTHGATVVLTVGSDCAIGKMTVSLELDAATRARGVASEFVPTGQTGIAIAGLGHLRSTRSWPTSSPARPSSSCSRASRAAASCSGSRARARCCTRRTPASRSASIHGSAPHAFVLCHMSGQAFVDDDERFPMPSLAELVELHERDGAARPAGEGRRDRAQHARARRGRRARRDRRGRGRDRPAGRRRRPLRRRPARRSRA